MTRVVSGRQPLSTLCARRIAHRLLAIGALEEQPARGEPVDVRRLDVLRAVAAEFGPQVVRDDEEDVEFFSAAVSAAGTKHGTPG